MNRETFCPYRKQKNKAKPIQLGKLAGLTIEKFWSNRKHKRIKWVHFENMQI